MLEIVKESYLDHLTNIQDSVSPEWNNYRYVGRLDDVYVYKGTQRSISFSMKQHFQG